MRRAIKHLQPSGTFLVSDGITRINRSSELVSKTSVLARTQVRSASTVTNIPASKIFTEDTQGSLITINGLEIPQIFPVIKSTFDIKPDLYKGDLDKGETDVFRYEPADLYDLTKAKPQLAVICEEDATLLFGKFGTNPNLDKPKPVNILDKKLTIPQGYNIIDVPPMVPLQIKGNSYQVKNLLNPWEYGEFRKVLSAKESIRAIEVDKILDLSYKNAELIAATLQGLIFAHPKQKTFLALKQLVLLYRHQDTRSKA